MTVDVGAGRAARPRPGPAPDVKICTCLREWEWVMWLCEKHRRPRAIPYDIRKVEDPPHPLECDECFRAWEREQDLAAA